MERIHKWKREIISLRAWECEVGAPTGWLFHYQKGREGLRAAEQGVFWRESWGKAGGTGWLVPSPEQQVPPAWSLPYAWTLQLKGSGTFPLLLREVWAAFSVSSCQFSINILINPSVLIEIFSWIFKKNIFSSFWGRGAFLDIFINLKNSKHKFESPMTKLYSVATFLSNLGNSVLIIYDTDP